VRLLGKAGTFQKNTKGTYWKFPEGNELVITGTECAKKILGNKYIKAREAPEMDIHYPLIVVYHTHISSLVSTS
jgi:hypothetical protein